MADGYSPGVLGNHQLVSSCCGLLVFITRSSAVANFLSLAIIKHSSKIRQAAASSEIMNASSFFILQNTWSVRGVFVLSFVLSVAL